MNKEKLTRAAEIVRIGGPGTVRRKNKAEHATIVNYKRFNALMNDMGAQHYPDVVEVNFYKDDGSIIRFDYPSVRIIPKGLHFVIRGTGKKLSATQAEEIRLSEYYNQMQDNDYDIPDLVA